MNEIHTGAKNAKPRPGPWTDAENAACLALYFLMHHKASNGLKYVKAAMIREAQGQPRSGQVLGHGHAPRYPDAPLSERSRPSIEMKLMNLSAVMESLGRNDLSMSEYGYRAMPNYQANLKTMAVALIAVRDEAVAGGFDQVQA